MRAWNGSGQRTRAVARIEGRGGKRGRVMGGGVDNESGDWGGK